ncbi:MAG: OmpW family protein [Geothrix sp.]|uniref:OmpW/AlkL family protein n=1 Tax=Geothrix sp. TaxID=1962974 RepID=UPI0018509611|nr:OmpW family outer membrane protein [Geothrix sp.]NWJ42002.1 OmpW family protein [Geothrix sp.]WIL20027.1 MAG: outer membrane beta-barrel protein [Geothrix sp.]
MKKLATLTLLAAALAAPSLRAEDGPWMVRLRAVALQPANKSDAAPGIPADAIHVSNKTIPEVDFSYFFTKNFSAELVLTVPQEHDVTLNGVKLGTFKHLPPTLTAQWRFLPGGAVDPYIGAGLNYTLISDVKLADGALDLDKSSLGLAAQAGVDIQLAPKWSLNVDVKYVQIKSDVKVAATGAKVTTVKVDPMLYGVGIGYRF